jgi:hypothetical protein
MEIERLPLGQSLADKHRAAELKWRRKPPGIPSDMAIEFMARLSAGSTVRKLTGGGELGPAMVSFDRFKKHCELHPKWAAEAWRVSNASTRILKTARFRAMTHCKFGHSLADARVYQMDGYKARHCRICGIVRAGRAGVIRPEVGEKVRALLKRNAPISSFTTGASGNYLMSHVTFNKFRREDSEIDSLASRVIASARHAAQHRRWSRVRNHTIREQNNDHYKIRDMIPENNPHRGDIVARIFEDLLSGSLNRDAVRSRANLYIAEFNRMFPTKYAKFGGSQLVSLDEVLFVDGSTTRGDTVSRGLWD